MAEQRMDLKAAGELLNLHPNAIRSRAKKGKIRYDTDNQGKIWVWLDPGKAANDRKPDRQPEPSIDRSNEPDWKLQFERLERSFESENSTLKVTIEGLNQELKAAREERDGLRIKIEERAGVATRLEIALAAITAKSEAAASEVESLRQRLEKETDENRKLLVEMLERMAAPKVEPVAIVPEPEPEAQTMTGFRALFGFMRKR